MLQLAGGAKRVVCIGGGLIISPMHRVQCDGVWMAASDFPDAEPQVSATALHNFVVRGRRSLLVDGLVVSTLGQFCPGAHDFVWPTHALWASERLVELLKRHPQWPRLILESNGGPWLRALKSEDFARANLAGAAPDLMRWLSERATADHRSAFA